MWNCTYFRHPADEQLRLVDTYCLATTIILSTLNTRGTCYAFCFIQVSLRKKQGTQCCIDIKTRANKGTAVASMRRTEALASVKFYQILSIFIFFIRLIILEDFIRLISYNGPCVRLGCSFFLATALKGEE